MPLIAATALAENDYITDGTKLYQVIRVTSVGVDCEDTMQDDNEPHLISLVRAVVERDWQKVIPEPKRPKRKPEKAAA
jgi:hypothetical protein